MKKRWTSNIKYFLIALLILVLGYFFGFIILMTIGLIILLMTIIFLIVFLFNKSLIFFLNKKVRLFIAMFFSLAISYGAFLIFWRFIKNIGNLKITFMVSWVIITLLFSVLWNVLVVRRRVIKTNNVFDYKGGTRLGIQINDVIFMLLIPTLFTIVLFVLKGLFIF